MKHVVVLASILIPCLYGVAFSAIPNKSDVFPIIDKVNTYWQSNNRNPGRAFWDNAAYHTGNMEAWRIAGNTDQLDYSIRWADQNEWKGAKGLDKSRWRYTYGETDDFVLFGDWQICFQTYADLYTFFGGPKKVARAVEVMTYEMSTNASDYWWWADALYMVMPVMTKLYKITGNEKFLEKLQEYFSYSKSIMYDNETGLFFRDERYVYPAHKSVNGKKDFWARGDGWVFAGLAKILQDIPADEPTRDGYIEIFSKMAETLADAQQSEGYWTRSLLDPAHAPGYETSGTAFFTFGFLWGINNGILDRTRYLPVVESAWEYLSTKALLSNGRIGYVQPIGDKAEPGTTIGQQQTSNFGVGAFLLACAEMIRFAPGDMPFFVYSATLDDPYRVTLRFNQKLDQASATNTENYSSNGLTVASATLTPDSTRVVLQYSEIPPGEYEVTIGSVTSASGDELENDRTFAFVHDTAVSATASAYESGSTNTPDKSLDGDQSTRWSAEGSGQWILYDLKAIKEVHSVDISYYNSNERTSSFNIELSTDGVNFEEVYRGETDQSENYDFATQEARYVRIIGRGNSANAWNSINEVTINADNIVKTTAAAPLHPSTAELQVRPAGTGSIHLNCPSSLSGPRNIKIVDLQGVVMHRRRVQFTGNHVTLNDVQLPPGLWYLTISGRSGATPLLVR